MSFISEKVAYLRGVAEGMQIDKEDDSHKLIKIIIDVLDSISEEIDDINDAQDELFDHVFDIEDSLELDLDDMDDDDLDDLDDAIGGMMDDYVVECPNCREEIFLKDSNFDSTKDISCPKCGTEIVLEFQDGFDDDLDEGEDK